MTSSILKDEISEFLKEKPFTTLHEASEKLRNLETRLFKVYWESRMTLLMKTFYDLHLKGNAEFDYEAMKARILKDPLWKIAPGKVSTALLVGSHIFSMVSINGYVLDVPSRLILPTIIDMMNDQEQTYVLGLVKMIFSHHLKPHFKNLMPNSNCCSEQGNLISQQVSRFNLKHVGIESFKQVYVSLIQTSRFSTLFDLDAFIIKQKYLEKCFAKESLTMFNGGFDIYTTMNYMKLFIEFEAKYNICSLLTNYFTLKSSKVIQQFLKKLCTDPQFTRLAANFNEADLTDFVRGNYGNAHSMVNYVPLRHQYLYQMLPASRINLESSWKVLPAPLYFDQFDTSFSSVINSFIETYEQWNYFNFSSGQSSFQALNYLLEINDLITQLKLDGTPEWKNFVGYYVQYTKCESFEFHVFIQTRNAFSGLSQIVVSKLVELHAKDMIFTTILQYYGIQISNFWLNSLMEMILNEGTIFGYYDFVRRVVFFIDWYLRNNHFCAKGKIENLYEIVKDKSSVIFTPIVKINKWVSYLMSAHSFKANESFNVFKESSGIVDLYFRSQTASFFEACSKDIPSKSESFSNEDLSYKRYKKFITEFLFMLTNGEDTISFIDNAKIHLKRVKSIDISIFIDGYFCSKLLNHASFIFWMEEHRIPFEYSNPNLPDLGIMDSSLFNQSKLDFILNVFHQMKSDRIYPTNSLAILYYNSIIKFFQLKDTSSEFCSLLTSLSSDECFYVFDRIDKESKHLKKSLASSSPKDDYSSYSIDFNGIQSRIVECTSNCSASVCSQSSKVVSH